MRFLFLSIYFMAPMVLAGVVEPKSSEILQKIQKSLDETELRGVNARLKIEGATFRLFNLYFSISGPKEILEEIRKIINNDLKIVGGFNFVEASKNDTDTLLRQK